MIALFAGWAVKALFNARSDAAAVRSWWGDLHPSTRKWIVRALLIVAGYFLHQHYAQQRISAAIDAAHTAQRNADQAVLDRTVANYRAATALARAADQKNATRVKAEQAQISERTADDYAHRIADARAVADRLRARAAVAPAHSGGGGAASVPGLSPASGGATQAAGEDRLPDTDALTATEQAIQLDELIKWIRAQAAVDVNGPQKGAKP